MGPVRVLRIDLVSVVWALWGILAGHAGLLGL